MKAYRRVRRYGRVAIALHWLVAAGIAFLFIHGFRMMHVAGPDRLSAFNLHRSVGVVVFALVLVRIWWRATHPPPHFRMPPVQQWVANYVHLLIYALLVLNGAAGTVGWIASGDPIVFFGMTVRPEATQHPHLNRFCLAIGFTSARALLVLIALHALAALKHHVLDGDRLLSRMWPGHTVLLPLHTIEMLQWAKKRQKRRRVHAGRCDKCGASLQPTMPQADVHHGRERSPTRIRQGPACTSRGGKSALMPARRRLRPRVIVRTGRARLRPWRRRRRAWCRARPRTTRRSRKECCRWAAASLP